MSIFGDVMDHKFSKQSLVYEIDRTTTDIEAALWQVPADIDRAKLLISKRMGLRICLGEVNVRLKKPVVHVVDSPLAA